MLPAETVTTTDGGAVTIATPAGDVLLQTMSALGELASVRLNAGAALRLAGELERHALHIRRQERERAAAESPLSPLSVLFAHQRPWRRSV